MSNFNPAGSERTVVLELPGAPMCREALRFAVENESAPISHHSIRSYLFGRLLLDSDGAADVDPDLLFLSCVLHDLGLTPAGNRGNRFEIDGADAAAEFLGPLGLSGRDVQAVWDAIALHSSPGLAERRSPLCRFTQAGVLMDFGWNTACVTDDQAMTIHRGYPRLGLAAALVDLVVGQAEADAGKVARYTLADTLVLERSGSDGLTRMERDEPHSRWALLELAFP